MLLIIGSIILGFLASFVSALFGGGSGLIFVPGIFWLLVHCHMGHAYLMQTTLATGFCLSIPIGFVSSMRQLRYKNIDFASFKYYWPWIIGGALVASILILFFHTHFLKIYFSIMILLTAAWLFRRRAIPAQNITPVHWPAPFKRLGGFMVGLISISMGVSVFIVPFLIKMGLELRRAIGTSTVLVFLYSIVTSISVIISGLHLHGLPHSNFGLVNIPITLAALIPTIIGSLIGAKLVNVIPQEKLKLLFVIMMTIVGLLMLIPN